jgi:GR25 family glycosyltransferase involved in LPS biosynthesis
MEEAYVINLKSSKDRWQTIQKSFEGINIYLKRVDPIKPIRLTKGLTKRDLGAQSLFLTVLKIVKDAKKNHLPSILILEDDCKPAPNFSEKWSNIKAWLDSHLEEWDIYSGGSRYIKDPFIVGHSHGITFYRPKKTYSAHFIYIHSRSYDTIIDRYIKDFKDNLRITIDGTNSNLKLIISHPFAAFQTDGKSTLTGKMRYLKDEFKQIEGILGRYKTRKLCHKSLGSYTRKKK